LPPADAAPRLPARAAPTPTPWIDPRRSNPVDRQGADSSCIAQFQRCYRGSIASQGHSTQRAHGDRRVPLRRSIYQPRRQNGRARSHRNVGDKCLRNYRVSTHPHILRTESHLSSKSPQSFFARRKPKQSAQSLLHFPMQAFSPANRLSARREQFAVRYSAPGGAAFILHFAFCTLHSPLSALRFPLLAHAPLNAPILRAYD